MKHLTIIVIDRDNLGRELVMALGVFSVLCWRRFRNLSFMEQFLDYRQVPNGTEVSETTEVIKQNGHIEEAKETSGEEAGTEEKGG